jgi:hypothetical protein
MTIHSMMRDRAALTERMNELPTDLDHEEAFKQASTTGGRSSKEYLCAGR